MGRGADLLEEFRDRAGVPAVVGAVVDRDGALQIDVTGSRRRSDPADLAATDDLWHIGSCGKSITAALYGRLVEAGLAEWSAPVRTLFPDLPAAAPGWSDPTVDDLLLCRAGVTPNPPRTQMAELWSCELSPAEQRHRATVKILSSPPDKPGRFRYSNLSYVVVAAAIDRLAGAPFEEALRVHVLEPLGIDSLGFGPPPLVCGHGPKIRLGPLLLGRGAPAPTDEARSDNPTLFNPAGRMHLTIADWATFQRVFLNEGRPLLAAETVRHLLTPPPDDPTSMAMGWAPAHRLDGVSYGMQGSNTMWAATALIDDERARTAMVVVNDGRSKVLQGSAMLAARLLGLSPG